jgi:hypothetical protein
MSGDRRFSQVYQIKVQGRLDKRGSDWFSGLAVEVESEVGNPPTTTLTGVLDQAGLRGVLSKVWDLNLALVSVVRLEETADPD